MRDSNPRIPKDGLGFFAEPEGIEPPYPVGYPAFSKRDYYRSSMAPCQISYSFAHLDGLPPLFNLSSILKIPTPEGSELAGTR